MKALVTGASRGIGRSVARRLAAQGAQLVLVARDAQALEALACELPASHPLSADLAAVDVAVGVVDRAVQLLSGLDVVINCAGLVRYAAVGEVSAADLALQLQVNFVAPFMIAQRAAHHMKRAGQGGCIVNVASTLGIRPAAQSSAYAASKAALLSMTRAFALELGAHDIRVNAVAPGVIDTDMVRVLRPGAAVDGGVAHAQDAVQEALQAQLSALRQLHPLGHLGTPQDVADAVVYLLDARFVTGSVLVIDGGLLVSS